MSRKRSNPPKPRGATPEPAEADRLDDAVYQILQELKEGTPVRLPGLGILRPGPRKSVLFDRLLSGDAKERADASKKQSRH